MQNSEKSEKGFLNYIGLAELSTQGNRAIFSFWSILFITFFLFADQNLIAPNLKNIASSLGIKEQSDIDWYLGGLIPILFFILGGTVSLSMGYLAQKFSRKNLFIWVVLLGEIPCLLTGFANTYSEFALYRTLCGFGLGGVFPLLFSLLGDYFSNKSRTIATAYISLAMGLGIGIGQLVGAILGESDPINGWRTSFIVLASPSFLLIGLYFIFGMEPKRGSQEEELQGLLDKQDEQSHSINLSDIKVLFSNKTNLGIFLQGIPGCVPWGVFFVFLADYYENTYGMRKAEAGGMLTIAAVGIFIGTFMGGIIGQWLYNKRKAYQPIFGTIAVLLGIIPCLFLLYSPNLANSFWFIPLNIFTGFIIALPMANIRSMLISVNAPKNRSAIFSIYNLTDDLGKGLGPALSALILTIIPDRTIALSVSILFWIPTALFWLLIIFNLEKDEKKVHDYLVKEAERLRSSAFLFREE